MSPLRMKAMPSRVSRQRPVEPSFPAGAVASSGSYAHTHAHKSTHIHRSTFNINIPRFNSGSLIPMASGAEQLSGRWAVPLPPGAKRSPSARFDASVADIINGIAAQYNTMRADAYAWIACRFPAGCRRPVQACRRTINRAR